MHDYREGERDWLESSKNNAWKRHGTLGSDLSLRSEGPSNHNEEKYMSIVLVSNNSFRGKIQTLYDGLSHVLSKHSYFLA